MGTYIEVAFGGGAMIGKLAKTVALTVLSAEGKPGFV